MDELEMMYPGVVEGLGQLSITEKESTIPHFDVIKNDGTKVSIMIQENRYMPGEKNSLNEEECKKLNEWAHGRKTDWWNRGDLNWYYMILSWGSLYNGYEIIYNQECLNNIPDYTTIYH